MLSQEVREFNAAAAVHYHAALGGAAKAYLYSRGFTDEVIARYQLGLVDGSLSEHADFVGRISLPYVTKLGGCVGFKFRRVGDGGEPKYLSNHMPTRLYNPLAFEQAERLGYIGLAEGETDCITLDGLCDIPTVGIPGVDTWQAHPEWRLLFDGFAKVYIFKDQDEAGEKLASRITHDLDSAVVVNLPAKDINETFLKHGAGVIRSAAGLD